MMPLQGLSAKMNTRALSNIFRALKECDEDFFLINCVCDLYQHKIIGSYRVKALI